MTELTVYRDEISQSAAIAQTSSGLSISAGNRRYCRLYIYWKNAKKINGKKSRLIKKEKEIVLIMPCIFFLVRQLPYLGNTYP